MDCKCMVREKENMLKYMYAHHKLEQEHFQWKIRKRQKNEPFASVFLGEIQNMADIENQGLNKKEELKEINICQKDSTRKVGFKDDNSQGTFQMLQINGICKSNQSLQIKT